MIRAPASLANWMAKMETPPVPWVSTVSPGLIPPPTTSACQAVSAAQGKVAASSKLRCSGMRTRPSSGSATSSASMPSASPPRAERAFVSSSWPPIQAGMKLAATRSPGLNRDAPGPAASTSPAPSDRGILGSGIFGL